MGGIRVVLVRPIRARSGLSDRAAKVKPGLTIWTGRMVAQTGMCRRHRLLRFPRWGVERGRGVRHAIPSRWRLLLLLVRGDERALGAVHLGERIDVLELRSTEMTVE